jgi:hypothetical protein
MQCGGGVDGNDGGADATSDVAQNDAASDVSANDAAKDAAANDASDGGGLACTSPAGCEAGTPLCCGTVVLNGGTPPNCTASSVTSACTTQCATAFVSNCSGTETVRLCAQASDCSDPTYNKCCTFGSGNQSLTFCSSQAIATGAGASCL